MKILRTLIAGFVAVACVSIAQAQTTIRFTGSTALRANTLTAIGNSLDPGFTWAYTGTNPTGANQSIYVGTWSGQSVIIKTAWSGSEGGMQTVAGSVAIPFLPNSTTTSTGGTPSATPATAGNGGDVAIPDVEMSDSYQSSSAFFGLYRGVTYPTLTESPNSAPNGVGIVPFKFATTKLAPAGLTNITDKQARALWGAGALPLAFFTGNPADETSTVVACGRDPDSGTRLNTSAEVGLGPQASVKHWQPLRSDDTVVTTINGAIAKFRPWPATTINGIPIAVFNGGYSSGNELSRMLANTTPANTCVVSYGSVNDIDTNSLPNGARELSYNGVTLGNTGGNYNNSTVLTGGEYTHWCACRVYYRSATGGTTAGNFADAIALRLKNVDAPILVSNMRVERLTDGGVVFPVYTTVPPPQ